MACGGNFHHIVGMLIHPTPCQEKSGFDPVVLEDLQDLVRQVSTPGGVKGKGHLLFCRLHAVNGYQPALG